MEKNDISKLRVQRSAGPEAGRKGKGRQTYIYAAVLIMAVIALYYFFSGAFATHAVKVRVAGLVYPSREVSLLEASGYVVAGRKASVASKTTGRLVWLGVEEGSRVKKGEIIARLEQEDLRAMQDQAKANLNFSKKNLEQARAELHDAAHNLDRYRELLASDFASKSAFDSAEARHKKAVAGVDAAKAEVAARQAALRGADVALEYALIRAPFDGVVLTKNADIGDIITPLGAAANAKAAVVTMADMDSLQVEVDVSESNIEKVRPGQASEVRLDALPGERFGAKTHMIVPTADRSKASVLVKVRFNEKDRRILPEMSAKVSFLSRSLDKGEEKPFLAIDAVAVVKTGGAESVFTEKDGRVRLTEVKTGRRLGNSVEVLSGLKEGDRVVINPPPGLADKSSVKVSED